MYQFLRLQLSYVQYKKIHRMITCTLNAFSSPKVFEGNKYNFLLCNFFNIVNCLKLHYYSWNTRIMMPRLKTVVNVNSKQNNNV